MPSPIGHVLGGIAVGHLVAGRLVTAEERGRSLSPARRWWRSLSASWPGLALFGLMGALPDADFLLGIHSRQTHSLGAALVVLVATALLARRHPRRWRLGLAVALAYASHILLDWLGNDTSAPIGIMALWPLTAEFYQSDLHWFPAIWRTYRPGFWTHNVLAVAWEVAVLGPIAATAWYARRSADPTPG